MSSVASDRGTERKKAAGHVRAKACTKHHAQRCRHCRYLAVVFRASCSLGDFATTKNATCSKWTAKREAAS